MSIEGIIIGGVIFTAGVVVGVTLSEQGMLSTDDMRNSLKKLRDKVDDKKDVKSATEFKN